MEAREEGGPGGRSLGRKEVGEWGGEGEKRVRSGGGGGGIVFVIVSVLGYCLLVVKLWSGGGVRSADCLCVSMELLNGVVDGHFGGGFIPLYRYPLPSSIHTAN